MSTNILDGATDGCASCVSRRTFLERVGAVAAAIILTGCGASDLTAIGGDPIPGGSLTIKLSDYTGLATVGQPVELRSASGASAGIAAVRTSATSFIALGMACTHEGTKVNIVGKTFDCPNHGAQFSSTGAVTRGPANRALVQRSVTYNDAAGTLTIA